MTAGEVITLVFAIANYALGGICAGHALMTKTRQSTSALAWILVCLSLPILGAILYLTIGQDRIGQRRASALREARARFRNLRAKETPAAPLMSHADEEGPLLMEDIVRRVADAPLTTGNTLDILVDGSRAYPAMLDAISSASKSIHVLFYLFDDDEVGKDFRSALLRRADTGIAVNLLYDAVGCIGAYRGFWEGFSHPMVKVAPFLPLRPLKRRWQMNLRNHRKLLVIDGTTAFVGSMNIGGRHLAHLGGRSRDLMLRVRGPVVARLDEVFADDWHFAAGEVLGVPEPTVEAAPVGAARIQVIASGPEHDEHRFHRVLLSAIHQAKASVSLVTPYFVPDVSLSDALTLAARRGLAVDLLVPQRPDSVLVELASREGIRRLLDAGGRVAHKGAPMLHMKLAVIDRDLTLVGSSNLDSRSLFLNFELDLAVHGSAFAARVQELIDDETKGTRRASALDALEHSRLSRFAARLAALFAPVL